MFFKGTDLKLLLLLATVTVLLTACVVPTTTSKELQRVSVRLGWQYNGEFAALANAQAEGFYDEEGLAVDVRTGGSGIDPLPLVAAGTEDFGVPASSGLIAAAVANSNMPLVAIGTLMQMTPSGYMYKLEPGERPGERTAADFAGKIVGAQPEGWLYVETLAKMKGLTLNNEVKSKDELAKDEYMLASVSWGPEPLLTNQVDFFNGWATNQAYILDQEGVNWGMVFISDYIPFFADVIVARPDFIEANPDLVRRFIRATMRGLQFALDNPEKTAKNVVNYGMEGLNYDKELWRLVEVQNAMSVSNDTDQHGLGYMNPQRWEETMRIMLEIGELDRLPSTNEIMTNEFLP